MIHYPIIGADYLLYPLDPATGTGLWMRSGVTLAQVYLDGTATVTYRVQDEAGVDVTGDTWPQTAVYVTGSQGKFVVLLRDTLAFTPHVECNCVITVDAGGDAHRVWKERLHPLPPEDAG
jgi:hypothetical protein